MGRGGRSVAGRMGKAGRAGERRDGGPLQPAQARVHWAWPASSLEGTQAAARTPRMPCTLHHATRILYFSLNTTVHLAPAILLPLRCTAPSVLYRVPHTLH